MVLDYGNSGLFLFMGNARLISSAVCFISPSTLLKGSWVLVSRVLNKETILLITYNPDHGTYNLTQSPDPPSSLNPEPYRCVKGTL